MRAERSSDAHGLRGTVALVTGASEGIGRATAVGLAAAGGTVVGVARRADRLASAAAEAQAAGGVLHPLVADLAAPDAAAEVVTAAVDAHGRLDVLVNNAGSMLLGDVLDADADDWSRMVDLNLMALMRCTQAALPHLMRAADAPPRYVADVVNVSSLSARHPTPGRSGYAATKSAVDAFTQTLRQEVAGARVRVALVAPGLTSTGLRSHNSPRALEAMERATPELANVEALNPHRIADAVRFIVCQPFDATITDLTVTPVGQTL